MPRESDSRKPISLFYSYSHKNEWFRQKLQEHLVPLKRSGMIAEWHDRKIGAGREWEKEIDHHLSSADIILLLVSSSFIASEYCRSVEVRKALERHERGEARVIPVILKPCRWQEDTLFTKLQVTPKNARPVTQWPDWDPAFDDVVSKIEAVVDELQRSVGEAPGSPGGDVQPKIASQVSGGLFTSPLVFADFAVFRDINAWWCPEMVALPTGEFLMGSPLSEEGRCDREGPQHPVRIGSRFAIGRYPTKFEEYDYFCDVTKRERPKDQGWGRSQRPVINVSWHDAQAYVEWLAEVTGKPYRLPSEAEWEYACRAGTTTAFSFGKTISPQDANYKESKFGKTTGVGSFTSNPWGLYDMHGNVWQWCADGLRFYTSQPVTDPMGPVGPKEKRLLRGGSWISRAQDVRSAYRNADAPGVRSNLIGFRCVRDLS